MLGSDNVQQQAIGMGTLITVAPTTFGVSIPATANAAGAAEQRCGQGASTNLFNVFNTEGYCLRDNVRTPEDAPLVTVEITNEVSSAGSAPANQTPVAAAPAVNNGNRGRVVRQNPAPAAPEVRNGGTCPAGTRQVTACQAADGSLTVAPAPRRR